jgi:hypothetical protein
MSMGAHVQRKRRETASAARGGRAGGRGCHSAQWSPFPARAHPHLPCGGGRLSDAPSRYRQLLPCGSDCGGADALHQSGGATKVKLHHHRLGAAGTDHLKGKGEDCCGQGCVVQRGSAPSLLRCVRTGRRSSIHGVGPNPAGPRMRLIQ